MKILYGIQTTGNGHLVRAKNLVPKIRNAGHEVHTLLSGDVNKDIKDLELFRPYTLKKGLTFYTKQGKIDYLKTAGHLNFFRFFLDVLNFDSEGFDLVITDYEPITARVARYRNILSIGVGHLYSFNYDIPIYKGDKLSPSVFVMKNFAPADIPLGMHWHHFGHPILPPMIPEDVYESGDVKNNKVLVYLPFENTEKIKEILLKLRHIEFCFYAPVDKAYQQENIAVRPLERDGFVKDLSDCKGVMCNSGFSLISEALHLGKKVFTKPVHGQVEQESNALALEELGLGKVVHEISPENIKSWMEKEAPEPRFYPDVAKELTEWIDRGDWSDPQELAERLWN